MVHKFHSALLRAVLSDLWKPFDIGPAIHCNSKLDLSFCWYSFTSQFFLQIFFLRATIIHIVIMLWLSSNVVTSRFVGTRSWSYKTIIFFYWLDLRLFSCGFYSRPWHCLFIFLDRWLSLAGKLSWDITTTQVNSALHPFRVTKSTTSFGWGKVTAARWQVTLMWFHMACDFSYWCGDFDLIYFIFIYHEKTGLILVFIRIRIWELVPFSMLQKCPACVQWI